MLQQLVKVKRRRRIPQPSSHQTLHTPGCLQNAASSVSIRGWEQPLKPPGRRRTRLKGMPNPWVVKEWKRRERWNQSLLCRYYCYCRYCCCLTFSSWQRWVVVLVLHQGGVVLVLPSVADLTSWAAGAAAEGLGEEKPVGNMKIAGSTGRQLQKPTFICLRACRREGGNARGGREEREEKHRGREGKWRGRSSGGMGGFGKEDRLTPGVSRTRGESEWGDRQINGRAIPVPCFSLSLPTFCRSNSVSLWGCSSSSFSPSWLVCLVITSWLVPV